MERSVTMIERRMSSERGCSTTWWRAPMKMSAKRGRRIARRMMQIYGPARRSVGGTPFSLHRARSRGRNDARHRRGGVVLRELLHLLGDVVAAEKLDQLQRLVEAGRDPAAGEAVSVDDEAGISLD